MKKILSLSLALSLLLFTAIGANANGWRGEKVRIYGEIAAIDGKMHTVTIRSHNGLEETFLVDSGTKIEQEAWGRDKYIMFSQLKVGQIVKAKYYENQHHYRHNGVGEPMPHEKGGMPLKVLRELEVRSK